MTNTSKTLQLYPFQAKATNEALVNLNAGKRVVVVAPTGAGKTIIGLEIARRAAIACKKVLWTVHRTVLVDQVLQAAERVVPSHLDCRTIQSMLIHGFPEHDLLILDECHHYAADEWKAITKLGKKLLGLTATPERADGKPLGHLFDALVVASNYPELVAMGRLVDAVVERPDRYLGSDLSCDPSVAYQELGQNRPGVIFCRDIQDADEVGKRIPGAAVVHSQKAEDRNRASIADFARGAVNVLVNVYVLTEGFDFPRAEVCVLARGCGHASTYLQMVGRVLRSSPGKHEALVIDLPGLSHVFGHPTAERFYSLERGIEWSSGVRVCFCHACGYCQAKAFESCPRCKELPIRDPRKQPKILNLSLAKAYKGEATPEDAKSRELRRLLVVRQRGNYSYAWVAAKYRKLFGANPQLKLTSAEKAQEYKRHLEYARLKGYKPGYGAIRYKDAFGEWPPRNWQ